MSERVENAKRWMKTERLLGMIVVLAGCPAVQKADELGGGGDVPARVQALFDTYCQNDASCHVAGGPQAPDLSPGGSAQGITGTSASGVRYVVFGDTANSFLAEMILPGAVGQMPPIGHPQPTADEIAIIVGWIGGAQFPEGDADTDTGMMTMTDTDVESSSGGEPQLCSLEVLDPSADVADAVDAGDGAMQIPTVIADALVRNCGCHYTDEVDAETHLPYTTGAQELATWANFQDNFTGVTPAMYDDRPAYEAVEFRLTVGMPPPSCDADGEPADENGAMTQEDFDLLMHWLGMGAPDGATYEPP